MLLDRAAGACHKRVDPNASAGSTRKEPKRSFRVRPWVRSRVACPWLCGGRGRARPCPHQTRAAAKGRSLLAAPRRRAAGAAGAREREGERAVCRSARERERAMQRAESAHGGGNEK
eukprot:3625006-Prymnesium_polylepis.1